MKAPKLEDKITYSYADGPEQVANLEAPDMEKGRDAAKAIDALAKQALKTKIQLPENMLGCNTTKPGSTKAKMKGE